MGVCVCVCLCVSVFSVCLCAQEYEMQFCKCVFVCVHCVHLCKGPDVGGAFLERRFVLLLCILLKLSCVVI